MNQQSCDDLFARMRCVEELRKICEDDGDVVLNMFREDDEDVVRIFDYVKEGLEYDVVFAVYKYGSKYFYIVQLFDNWKTDVAATLENLKQEIPKNTMGSLYDIGLLMCKWQEVYGKEMHIDWDDVIEKTGGDDYAKTMVSKVKEWAAARLSEKLAEEERRSRRVAEWRKEREANVYTDIMNTLAFFEAGEGGDPYFREKRLAQQRFLQYNIRQIANDELRYIVEKKASKYL